MSETQKNAQKGDVMKNQSKAHQGNATDNNAPVVICCTAESMASAPQIVREVTYDQRSMTGNIIISDDVPTDMHMTDPVVEIFISVRNRFKSRDSLLATILPPVKTESGLRYIIMPGNVHDGQDFSKEFEKLLLSDIAPDFEERLRMFFEDETGFAQFKKYFELGDDAACREVVTDFIYNLSSPEERRRMKKKAAREEKARRVAAENRRAARDAYTEYALTGVMPLPTPV